MAQLHATQNKPPITVVLIPGLDGTGELFAPFLQITTTTTHIIRLPHHTQQDYQSLAEHISQRLPNQPFVLLLESFSGGLAFHLSNLSLPQLKGIIFCASFISPPNRVLPTLGRLVPIKKVASIKAVQPFIQKLLFGRHCTPELFQQFLTTIEKTPETTLKNRLLAIKNMHSASEYKSLLPVLHIQARHDWLVSSRVSNQIKKTYINYQKAIIDGPHFILQTKPHACEAAISEFLIRID